MILVLASTLYTLVGKREKNRERKRQWGGFHKAKKSRKCPSEESWRLAQHETKMKHRHTVHTTGNTHSPRALLAPRVAHILSAV